MKLPQKWNLRETMDSFLLSFFQRDEFPREFFVLTDRTEDIEHCFTA